MQSGNQRFRRKSEDHDPTTHTFIVTLNYSINLHIGVIYCLSTRLAATIGHKPSGDTLVVAW